MARRLAAALLLGAGAAGHGVMTLPGSRQGGSLAKAAVKPGSQAAWYSKTKIPGKPTMCDPAMYCTTYLGCQSSAKDHPWYAPGAAPVASPCGNLNGGKDGRDLPKTPREVWQAGTEVKAAWAIQNNHGGGYAYRLCPAGEEQTEACFQRGHLQFACDSSVAHYINGTEVTFPAATTTTGTTPAGSMWRRNSVPYTSGAAFGPPCPKCVGDHPPMSIVDYLALPAGIAPGDYTLSWRWECETLAQVWLSCADITVTGGGGPAPAPAPAAKYSCVGSTCVADPSGVDQKTCLAVCKSG